MSDTVLEHPLVREYLRALGLECISLPVAQARELREQIAAHLDEALSPGATNAEVDAELARLGSPQTVAAAFVPHSVWRQLRNSLSHVRWWAWVALFLVVAAASTGAGLLISMRTAAPLRQFSSFAFYFPQDGARQVQTQAGDTTQITIPQRYRQEQGFIINIVNDSDWTQTVLGADERLPFFGNFSNQPAQVAVGSDKNVDRGGMDYQIHWSATGSVPPHSVRALRVLWDSNLCWIPGTPPQSIQDIALTVRVGSVTRTEDIRLFDAVGLAGNKGAQCR
jgi:hypothetical protein